MTTLEVAARLGVKKHVVLELVHELNMAVKRIPNRQQRFDFDEADLQKLQQAVTAKCSYDDAMKRLIVL